MQWTSSTSRLPSAERRLSFFSRARSLGDPMHERVEAFLGANVKVRGDVSFSGGLRVDGHVTGDVVVSGVDAGTLTIGDGGQVDGNVRVSHLVVYGRINGNVHATGLVDVRSNALIEGDLHYGSIEMAAGAVIRGRLIRHKGNSTF
ncbi:MAG: polymer-forming cytoskeletal protein [Rubrivivax sp.]|nr:polymer-forming cytoskeletal protein [Rubrivivax sp.]